MKKKIAIIIGGQSTEHEVSLISGTSILKHIDKKLYDCYLVGITKDGSWYKLPLHDYLNDAADISKVSLRLDGVEVVNISFQKRAFVTESGEIYRPDLVFPVLHGKNGEDGSVQGLFQLLDIPVVGCGIASSAVCMDKDLTKRLLDQAEVANAKYITYRKNEQLDTEKVVEYLGLPLFVKSANSGSSIGVSKVHNEKELLPAIEEGLRYDDKVVMEAAVVGRELECSVFGKYEVKAAIELGEIIPANEEYYSYGAKYVSDNGVSLAAPADIDAGTAKKIRDIAVRVYRCLECAGLARVDFFLTEKGEVLVNEVNTMPGFTSISMYPKLWELSGVGYAELVNSLIKEALKQ